MRPGQMPIHSLARSLILYVFFRSFVRSMHSICFFNTKNRIIIVCASIKISEISHFCQRVYCVCVCINNNLEEIHSRPLIHSLALTHSLAHSVARSIANSIDRLIYYSRWYTVNPVDIGNRQWISIDCFLFHCESEFNCVFVPCFFLIPDNRLLSIACDSPLEFIIVINCLCRIHFNPIQPFVH